MMFARKFLCKKNDWGGHALISSNTRYALDDCQYFEVLSAFVFAMDLQIIRESLCLNSFLSVC
ncbi:hypothetical protein [Moraxella lacunata]|uniref:hypothetical protein n=1 Tax=Moraxella lacunata TaxID=477 RepID=UPI003EE245BC